MLEVAHDDRQKDFRSIEEVLDTELDKLHRLSHRGHRAHRHAVGLQGPRRDHRRLPARQPDHHRRPPVDGQVGARHATSPRTRRSTHNAPVALFSLEMSETELAQRFVASQARIKGDELRKGRVAEHKWPKILEASQRLARAPLFIDDSSDIGLLEIRAKARRLHQQHGLGLIIIDYLQLMRADGRIENRVEQIGQMSRGLKILARELECPVIALSQLNRGVEQRTDKRPVLSDLRESGSIEQDADLVVFIYRDEYYDRESEREGEADIIIAKHRNGAIGDVTLTFQKEYPKFLNYAGERFQ